MATATPRFNRAEADRRVRHPLHAIRGTIRRYVALEGLAVGVLYLALAFWVGLALDWGLFALFGFDWIKSIDHAAGNLTASFWLRALFLGMVIAGLIAVISFKVLRRLFREFRDSALALVLERRFPRELGDRLITAVEMADPKLSEKYGFSQDMLDQTIRDAADRVSKLPVHEVFAWGRLYWRLSLAAFATVGVYLLTGVVTCIIGAATGQGGSPVAFFHDFNDIAGTWMQRNVLLRDRAYWVGNEYLEYVRFPDHPEHPGEMRVARDEYRPDIWFRAVKWARIERTAEAPEGLRALRWSDLPGLLGSSMPQVNLPANWGGWVIDMDDLDPSIPAGVIPSDWGWHHKTSGAIRADLVEKRLDAKRKWDAITRQGPRVEKELAQQRAALKKAEPVLAKFEEQHRKLESALAKTQAELKRQEKDKKQDPATVTKLEEQQKALAAFLEEMGPARTEVARARYEIAQREQLLAELTKSRQGLDALQNGLAAVDKMLDWQNWTVDKLELQHTRSDVRQALKDSHPDADTGITKALSKLAELADAPGWRGTLRALKIPARITVTRRGKAATNTSPRPKEENNKYSFSLNDLKESVDLTVSGNEYTTPPRKITLVPPPMVARLSVDKEEPAYIYYRLLIDDAEKKLKGKRQIFRGVPVSTTGEKTVISVPLGSNLTVTAVADRDLKDGVRAAEPVKRDEAGSFTPQVEVKLRGDRRTFQATFANVTRVIEFDFTFRDKDDVKGRRHIVIKPVDDKLPTLVGVNLAVVLRPDYDAESSKGTPSKSGERLLITPNAILPFKGTIADDRGLSRIEWPYKFFELEFQKLGETIGEGGPEKQKPAIVLEGNPRTRRAGLVLSTFQYMPGMQGYEWFAPAYLGGISYLASVEASRPTPRLEPEKGTVDLESFLARARQVTFDDVTPEELDRLLQIQPRNRTLALELLDLKKDEQKAFVDRLKENNQQEALLTDVLHFLKLTDAERGGLLGLVQGQPEEVVRRVLTLTSADKEEQDRLKTLLRKQPERAIVKDVALDPLDTRSGFDLRKYLPKLKAGSGETQRHYELHLFVSATDNNIEAKKPGTAPPKGPFVFLVVSENELLAEILKQEQKLYNLLKEAVDGLEARKKLLELEIAKLSVSNPDLVFMAVRADQARKQLRETGDIARGVLEKYNFISAELRVNRIEGEKAVTVETKIVNPLASMTNKSDGDFGIVDRTVTGSWRGLEEDVAKIKKAESEKNLTPALQKELEERRDIHRLELERSGKQIGSLVGQLRGVLEAMSGGIREHELIALMVQIEAQRRENHALIVTYQRDLTKKLIDDLLGPEEKKDKKQK